ncbi:hypothetical protein BCR39DRAFT_303308 [Naematelia encephala]|uniref:Uncharacterized protein n=1 Tax=Naematelia encephala TaxID=71784 RepID=A0A1Y2BFZ1_9TREE|nr:hypothetical protein BCR39DRAFT_303308 [Naematelia encephala]
MSGRRSLQDEVSSLKSELELSAFLNKGVLQTNSENKLRIAELQRENAVLRTAEARLSRTEDALETARAQLARHEASIQDLEDELKGEASARSVIERERDEWRNKFKRVLERSREYMGLVEALDVEIKGVKRRNDRRSHLLQYLRLLKHQCL